MKYIYITAVFLFLVSCSSDAIDSTLRETNTNTIQVEIVEEVSNTEEENISTQQELDQEMIDLMSESEVENQQTNSEVAVEQPEIEVIETPAVSEPTEKKSQRSGSSGY